MADPRPAAAVRRLVGADELAQALALRELVFCGEQGVSRAAERDGRDDEAIQLGAFTSDGELVGTCRLLARGPELVVQRVAVRANRRRRGVGTALIDAARAEAQTRGAACVTLHAQLASSAFYDRAGFVRHGPTFLEAGIEHVAMRAELIS